MSALSKIITEMKNTDETLGSTEAKKILESLAKSMQSAYEGTDKSMTGMVDSMRPNFKKEIIELIAKLESDTPGDKIIAFEKLKSLQEKFGFSLFLFLKTFGLNIEKLNKVVDNMEKNEQKRQEIIASEQALLQQEGVNYKTDDKGNIQVLNQKERLQEIYDIQNQVNELRSDRLKLQKDFEKGQLDSDKFKADLKVLDDRAKKLEARKIGVGYDDPNRPKTLREKFTGAAQGVGGFFRGERGPEMVQMGMGAMYQTAMSPIEAGRQMMSQLNMLTFGLSGAITRGMGNLLRPVFNRFTSGFGTGLSLLGDKLLKPLLLVVAVLRAGFLAMLAKLGLLNVLSGLGNLLGVRSLFGKGAAANMQGKPGKFPVRGAGILAAGTAVFGAAQDFEDINKRKDAGEITESQAKIEKGGAVGEAGGGVAGAVAGAKLGAVVGSAVPIVGTLVGGLLGGAAGYFLGSKIGKKTGQVITSAVVDKDVDDAGKEAFLRRKRDRDNDMPLASEFASVNERFMDQQRIKPTTSNNNAIVAPTNNINNSSTTQVVSIETVNPDKTYINLNPVMI